MAHFYGYVYFRQVKDVSVKRGYFQKVSIWNDRNIYFFVQEFINHCTECLYFHLDNSVICNLIFCCLFLNICLFVLMNRQKAAILLLDQKIQLNEHCLIFWLISVCWVYVSGLILQ